MQSSITVLSGSGLTLLLQGHWSPWWLLILLVVDGILVSVAWSPQVTEERFSVQLLHRWLVPQSCVQHSSFDVQVSVDCGLHHTGGAYKG